MPQVHNSAILGVTNLNKNHITRVGEHYNRVENDKANYKHSLMVRRSFLQKEERRSRARLNCPVFSVSSNRRRDGSERAATSPTGRRATVGGPSETPKLSKHTGPAEHSSLAEDRTRARVVVDCRPQPRRLKPPPRPVEVDPRSNSV